MKSYPSNILSTKRIAKNATLLYVRTFIVLCISLYISRLVLAALGVEDLGIYNVVAGIITLMAFFQAALTKSTGRFITFDIGAGSSTMRQRYTFGACLGIHCLIALVIIILAETIGVWILHYYTIIPRNRLYAAEIVYQLSVLTFATNLICIPYSAVIIAHEKMSIYAIISIVEAILKLIGVLLIPIIGNDVLITYGVFIAIVAFIVLLINAIFVIRRMPVYKTAPRWEKQISLQVLSFSGWTILGSATNTGTQQGVALLFNNFVSLAANAALGFANQVNAALGQFVVSFTTAFNPQVIKLCAANERYSLHRLMERASKISFVLAYLIALPLISSMDYILELWLVKVPLYTTEFCRLILVCTVIDATTSVFNTAITATGKIRNYQIAISISFTLDLICAYILLVYHMHPAIVFGSRIITRGIINMFIGLFYSRSLLGFDIKKYTYNTIVPIIMIILLTTPINVLIAYNFETLPKLLLCFFADTILIITLSYFIILTRSERYSLTDMLKKKLYG